jgi:hypothetical protein
MPSTTQRSTLFRAAVAFALSTCAALASESPAVVHFRKTVQPILAEYCSDCHADGAKKGNVAFDGFKNDEELLAKKDLWFAALKNVRAGLMPPEKKPKPTAEQRLALEKFIKADVFEIDPANPDPGKVTIRRLNRNEYRNTIRDLMGYDYKVEEELPPDDTGYGFDTIGDVLTMSPLLMEKYMQAAETITKAAVPRASLMAREKTLIETKPRSPGGNRMSFYETNRVSNSFKVDKAGTYRVHLDLEVFGQFESDPGRTHIVVKAGEKEVFKTDLGWQSHYIYNYSFEEKWQPGDKPLILEATPLTPKEKKKNTLEFRVAGLRVEGPLEKEYWVHPKNFERFFTKEPPKDPKARREYAREILKRFADKAYRRPVDERTLNKLVALAEQFSAAPGKKFEDGLAEAMTPILASPRFLFRIEETEPGADANQHPLIDEYALASRLSYFLWSTMPDEELFRLASRHELRKNLKPQIDRMLHDSRSEAFVQNFVGQWLQARDVEGIDINVRAVLARDGAENREMTEKRKRLEELRDIPDSKLTPEQNAEMLALRKFLFRPRNNQNELDGNLRRALREEAEKVFAYIARDDRSIVEFLNADYTFLNERLATHYGIPNVKGQEMRLVKLPADSPRGGVLTEGVALIVTSNPTRTSPVKRGLFVLDNLLGMPPPPPPPDVPALEQSKDQISDHEPTVRELLEIHRAKPLCSSCHNRMDPLGFALENFNAMGMWRETERGQKIDASGSLITGEKFQNIHQVKEVLATKYRQNFYRCLTEKMLIYALGRGLEYYDVEAVDRIVENLNQHDGHFSALLSGIIESAPFQKRRTPGFAETLPQPKPSETRASLDK